MVDQVAEDLPSTKVVQILGTQLDGSKAALVENLNTCQPGGRKQWSLQDWKTRFETIRWNYLLLKDGDMDKGWPESSKQEVGEVKSSLASEEKAYVLTAARFSQDVEFLEGSTSSGMDWECEGEEGEEEGGEGDALRKRVQELKMEIARKEEVLRRYALEADRSRENITCGEGRTVGDLEHEVELEREAIEMEGMVERGHEGDGGKLRKCIELGKGALRMCGTREVVHVKEESICIRIHVLREAVPQSSTYTLTMGLELSSDGCSITVVASDVWLDPQHLNQQELQGLLETVKKRHKGSMPVGEFTDLVANLLSSRLC